MLENSKARNDNDDDLEDFSDEDDYDDFDDDDEGAYGDSDDDEAMAGLSDDDDDIEDLEDIDKGILSSVVRPNLYLVPSYPVHSKLLALLECEKTCSLLNVILNCGLAMHGELDDDDAFDIAPKKSASSSKDEKGKKPAPVLKSSKGKTSTTKKSPLSKKGSGQHLEIEYEEPTREKAKLRR